jgi:hypothetical protein
VDEVKSDINALLGQMHNDMLVNGSAWDELIHMMNSTPRNQTYKQIEPYLFSLESDLLKNSRYRLKFHQEFTKEGARGDVYLNQLLKGVTMLLSMETDGFFGRSSVELASFYINIETMTVTGAYPKDIKHDQLKKILALFFELLEKKCNFKINIT